jgi:RNA polymerase sigma-70 factor, ECF subfamily
MSSPVVSGSIGSTSSSLIDLARAGDDRAWRMIVQLYGSLLYHWCRQSSLQPADAADVVQEVFRTVAANCKTSPNLSPMRP